MSNQNLSSIEPPKCGGCELSLNERIEWILDNPDKFVKFANKILNKGSIETGEDLAQGLRYCHNCGYKFNPQESQAIVTYANSYLSVMKSTNQ